MKTVQKIAMSLGITGALVGAMIQTAPSAEAATVIRGTVTCASASPDPVSFWVAGEELPRLATLYPSPWDPRQATYAVRVPPQVRTISISVQCGWNEWGIPAVHTGSTTLVPGRGTAYRSWWCSGGRCHAY